MPLRNLGFWIGLATIVCSVGESAKAEPTVHRLWPDDAPGALGSAPNDIPTLIHHPASSNQIRSAVVVCPGGGYGGLAMGHEGDEIAAWLNRHQITAFILNYRHRGKGYGHPAPLLDAQRAVRMVRAKSTEWGVNPNRIGIMGFSAGGHLASTVATHFDEGQVQHDDTIERVSCRPDFVILCYPVIALDEPFTHRGSRKNLLGDDPSLELVHALSNERQVTPNTPPMFLFHTHEDVAVPPENSLVMYRALRDKDVPAELHIYQVGKHGVGLAKSIPGTSSWSDRCLDWLRSHDVIP
jgi:acetyl esterase/lipase